MVFFYCHHFFTLQLAGIYSNPHEALYTSFSYYGPELFLMFVSGAHHRHQKKNICFLNTHTGCSELQSAFCGNLNVALHLFNIQQEDSLHSAVGKLLVFTVDIIVCLLLLYDSYLHGKSEHIYILLGMREVWFSYQAYSWARSGK